jgi:ribosomal protein L18E
MSDISGVKSYVVSLSQALKQTSQQSTQQLEQIANRISKKSEAATDVGLSSIQRSNSINEALGEYRNKIDTFA